MNAMAKRKDDRDRGPAITARLDEAALAMLRFMAEEEERTQTKILERAIRMYAQAGGYEWSATPKPKEKP